MKPALAMFLGLAVLLATRAAAGEFAGTLPSGAEYHIAVPDGWRAGDRLVLYQHGFDFNAPGTPGLGPLAEIMLGEGYAIAATSYRQRGWALFHAVDDNRDLVGIFDGLVGTPGSIVPFGGSMGGEVALQLAAAPGFPPVDGVYALCPAAAGARVWDQAIDLRLAYEVICDGTGSLPTGAEPLPWAVDLDDIPDGLGDLDDAGPLLDALVSINRCTGVDLPPALRNGAMRDRLAQLMAFGHFASEDFLVTNLGYATFALADLVRAPDKLGGANPFTTAGVDYADPEVDAGIARIGADPLAAFEFHWLSDFRGDIGAARIVSLQTSRDELVIPANQSVLRDTVPADQLASVIVAEDSPSHCGFSEPEGRAGWEALRGWIDGGAQPDAASLQQDCQSLVAGGADGECRFDPAAQALPAFDSRVPPRPPPQAPAIDARYSGSWFDPERSGEGVVLEVLNARHAVIYFFTYPPAGEYGVQAWMTGVGSIDGNGIAFEDVRRPQAVGTDANGQPILEQTPWGRLWLVFDDCNSGHLRWEGPAGWGSATVPVVRLSAYAGLNCDAADAASDLPQSSGLWFDPARALSGFAVEQLDADTQQVFWFDPGRFPDSQTWALGMVPVTPTPGAPAPLLSTTQGTSFGSGFDADAVSFRLGYGALDWTPDCGLQAHALLSQLFGFVPPPIDLDLQRLTRPAGTPACPP
jgi:hypothetical protein